VKLAVVAAGYADPWREDHLLARRVAGALACSGDTDLLVPGGARRAVDQDGAVRVLLFRSTPHDARRRLAWRRAVFGIDRSDDFRLGRVPRPRRDLPDFVEGELVSSEGGDAPELYDHLRTTAYDLVVFVGYHSPVAYSGVRAVGDNRRLALVPATRDDATFGLRVHDDLFDRAERILVCTESERAWVAERVGPDGARRIENVGFVVGVNSLAQKTEPPDYDGRQYLILARNWHDRPEVEHLLRWVKYLEDESGFDLRLRFAGPGSELMPYGLARTESRLDIWRWVSRAFALFDPTPSRVVGREVLEAYLYETPVIVNAAGAATQEHAEHGNGGLWYRTNDEFYAVVEALLDQDLRSTLGQQGRLYAEDTFGDTDAYIKRITSALLS
jgi:hypothetical protein